MNPHQPFNAKASCLGVWRNNGTAEKKNGFSSCFSAQLADVLGVGMFT